MRQHRKIYNPLKPEISRLLRKTKASFRSAGRLCCPSGEKSDFLRAKRKA